MSVESLNTSGVARLTTYRDDGSGVGTPVNLRIKDGKVYFMTPPKAAKAKRLARDPEAALAPSTPTGKLIGPSVRGRARPPGHSADKGFRTRFWIFARIDHRNTPITYEVTLEEL
ncbi:hypothetical protein [Nonomuraea sp. KM88]|uniref:hypothetical protein n=1 Tax=Nonomuraea sp. KM88 TaxID=3457427 RepID=UPI003FCED58F